MSVTLRVNLDLTNIRVAIVGLGLMGASLGYDLRGHCRRVTGVVRREEAIEEALTAGCVDDATTDAEAAIAEADLVILATPARVILRQIAQWGPLLRPGAVLMDLGSTKEQICRAMSRLPEHVQAIGGHPMCGKEQAGLAAAEPGLYRDCTFVLCPLPRTNESTRTLALELVQHIQARPLWLDPSEHDRLVAAISHLPYLAACSQVAHAMRVADDDPRVWDVAASGFRDSTRVAASSVDMLMDILLTNKKAVLASLDDYQEQLERLRQRLERDDEAGLRASLNEIAHARRAWREQR
ncbi:MAG: prephenate dehydrogenase [Chloroflexi bacterium]|nr:prephenate dehydrogenase [Chloroflexota bacterium]